MEVAEEPRAVLVVSPCSARKRGQPADAPDFDVLANRSRRLAAFRRFQEHILPARELYAGQHHQLVVDNLTRLRRAFPQTSVDLAIISAGYGLLDERDPVVPYEATFSGLSNTSLLKRAKRLGIRQRLTERLRTYDLAIFLLGKRYLTALRPPLDAGAVEIYFAAPVVHLSGERVVHIAAGVKQAQAMGVAPRMARAALFARFVDTVVADSWLDTLRVLSPGFQPASRLTLGAMPS